jgi:hypothetical protein
MLKCNAAKALRVVAYDIDVLAKRSWATTEKLALAAVRQMKVNGNGTYDPMSDAERLLNLRNAMLMELTGKVSDDEEIWRVVVNELGVKALYIGLGSQAPIEAQVLSGLPEWMQERVSVLSMLTERPPTAPIEGVGRRITDTVYWIVK